VIRLLTLASLLALSSPALAQPKKPDAAAIKKANGHFKLGQEFFKSGQWDRAITEYQAALDLTGEPLMVFNIALAHDRAGRPEQALDGYLKYLDAVPDGAIADEARGYVAKLTPVVDKLKQQRAADDAAKADEAKRQQEAAAKQAELAKQAEAAKAAKARRDQEADAIEHRGTGLRLGGMVGIGVGALVAGFGIKKGLDAKSISNELSDHQGAWTDEQIGRDAAGRDANTKMIIFTSIGAAVAVTGGVLYVIGRGAHAKAEKLRVGIAPGGASFSVRF
jgi:tetratricopeptide (TPR) repeat protein